VDNPVQIPLPEESDLSIFSSDNHWVVRGVRHKDQTYEVALYIRQLNLGAAATHTYWRRYFADKTYNMPTTHQFTDFLVAMNELYLRNKNGAMVNDVAQFLAEQIELGIHTDTRIKNCSVMQGNDLVLVGDESLPLMNRDIEQVTLRTRENLFGRENKLEISTAYRWATAKPIRIQSRTNLNKYSFPTHCAGIVSDSNAVYIETDWSLEHEAIALGMTWAKVSE